MALVCNRQILINVLRDMIPVTAARTTLPILTNVLFTASNLTEVTIIGSNLEATLAVTIEVNECDVPDFVIEARLLLAWLSNQVSEFVTLDIKQDHVVLQSGKSKTKANMLNVDEFPNIQLHNQVEFVVDPFDFGNALAQAVHGASSAPNEVRQYARGVYFEIKNHRMRFTGLNGIYAVHCQLATSYANDCGIGIIPQRTINSIAKLLATANSDASVYFETNKLLALQFTTKTYRAVHYQVNLIECQFPAFDRMVPNGYDLCMVFDKDVLLRSINNCLLFSVDDANRLYFEVDSNGCYLRSQSNTRGENEDYLQAINLAGSINYTFILNARYLIDWLRVINTDHIQMECQGSDTKPIMWRDADLPDRGFLLIPPMVLRDN